MAGLIDRVVRLEDEIQDVKHNTLLNEELHKIRERLDRIEEVLGLEGRSEDQEPEVVISDGDIAEDENGEQPKPLYFVLCQTQNKKKPRMYFGGWKRSPEKGDTHSIPEWVSKDDAVKFKSVDRANQALNAIKAHCKTAEMVPVYEGEDD